MNLLKIIFLLVFSSVRVINLGRLSCKSLCHCLIVIQEYHSVALCNGASYYEGSFWVIDENFFYAPFDVEFYGLFIFGMHIVSCRIDVVLH